MSAVEILLLVGSFIAGSAITYLLMYLKRQAREQIHGQEKIRLQEKLIGKDLTIESLRRIEVELFKKSESNQVYKDALMRLLSSRFPTRSVFANVEDRRELMLELPKGLFGNGEDNDYLRIPVSEKELNVLRQHNPKLEHGMKSADLELVFSLAGEGVDICSLIERLEVRVRHNPKVGSK